MDPLRDDELSDILRKLDAAPAPSTLEARIFGSRSRRPKGWWWERTIYSSVRIPIPVLTLAGLAFFALGAFAFRGNRPTQLSLSTANPGAAQRADGRAVRLDHGALSVPSRAMDRNVMTSPEAAYPPEAKTAGLQGIVKLQVRIGTDGRVTEARIISGDPALAPAAVQAVRQRVYRPTLLNGKPIAVISQAEVAFRLEVALTSNVKQ